MDVRFTSLPHTISPLWSIELNPEAQTTSHVKYVTNRKVNDRKYSRLFDIILNRLVEAAGIEPASEST